MNLNAEQLRRAERLSWYLEDFGRFCALLDITTKSGRRTPFRLNEIQRAYLKNASPRDVILKPRQVGMTTLLLARDVYRFLTVRGAHVVIVCQSMTGNAPIANLATSIRRYFDCLRRAGLKLEFSTEKSNEWAIASRDTRLQIIVAGASEASALKVGRSGTVTHLHCTELAFWEYAEETMNALLECVPGLEHGSEIVTESTPNGAAGVFYRQCKLAQSRESGYRFHFFPWYQATEYSVPLDPGEIIEPRDDQERRLAALGATPAQLKWRRHKIADKPATLVDQEYPSDPDTCFLVSGRCFFDQDRTTRLLESAGDPIEARDKGRVRIYEHPKSGRAYVLAVDTAEGGGGDPSAGIVYDRDTGEHVATIDGHYPPWELARASAELARYFNDALVVVERNNHGHAVLQALTREIGYQNLYLHEDQKLGWPTNPVTRPVMLDALEDAHRKALWSTCDGQLIGQLRTFVVTDSGKPEAARGEHDDMVMAAAIGWAVRQKPMIDLSQWVA